MVNFEAIHWNISSCMKLIFLKCMCRLNSVQNISSNIMDILFFCKRPPRYFLYWGGGGLEKKFVKWKLSWILAVGSTSTIFLLCYLFTNLENVELGYDEGGVYELRLRRMQLSWSRQIVFAVVAIIAFNTRLTTIQIKFSDIEKVI